MEYTHRAKIGKTGRQVHACRKVVTGTRKTAGRVQDVYYMIPACTVVNSHNVNNHPGRCFVELPDNTPITCQHCLAITEAQS